MDPNPETLPRRRPLEANSIDHIVRCYGGRTIAIEMEPRHMQKSKQSVAADQHIGFLNRSNGELRLELTFYRECFKHAEKFKEKITTISQDLLHECIIGLLDDAAFDEIRDLSKALVDAVEQLRHDQEKAFDDFIAPYRASQKGPRAAMSTDGWI